VNVDLGYPSQLLFRETQLHPGDQQIWIPRRAVPPKERLACVPLDCKVVRRSRNNDRRVIRIAGFIERLTYPRQTGRHWRVSVVFAIDEKHWNFDLFPEGQRVEVAD